MLLTTTLIALLGTALPQDEPQDLSWVFLKTGPRSADLPADEMQTAMAGHFSNMGVMTEAGHLLVAGPLGEPRSDPMHRGIFVFDAATPERALEIAGSDPAVQAGVFVLEAHTWRSSDPMHRIVELDRADLTARQAARPDEEVAWEGRGYVLVSTPDGNEAEQALEPLIEEGLVLFRGALDGTGLLACLDVTDADEARDMLAAMGELMGVAPAWSIHPWYASRGIARLPFHRAHPAAPTFDVRPLVSEEGPSRMVLVFGLKVVAGEGVADARLLRTAHLLAQYIDPDEDGEAEGLEKLADEWLVVGAGGTPGGELPDPAPGLRRFLEEKGLSPPGATPDGSYRGD